MSILRTAASLRPLLRTPAPALARGIRNWDVNTPTEGAVVSDIQGASEPTLDSANQAQESGNVSAEDKAFANASRNYLDDPKAQKGAGELNKGTVDTSVNRDIGKVSERCGVLTAGKPRRLLVAIHRGSSEASTF